MAFGVVLHGVQDYEIEALWPSFWNVLKRTNEFHPAFQIEEEATRNALKDKKIAGFYFMEEGEIQMALTVEVVKTHRGSEAEITAIGGEGIQRWLDGIDSIENWTKSIGCDFLRVSGSEAWYRLLKGKGFEKISITVEKAL